MVGLWGRKGSGTKAAAENAADGACEKQLAEVRMERQVLASFRFKEESIIGWGASSTVYKAVLGDGTAVALKRVDLKLGLGFEKGLQILMEVQHPNLATILGWDLWRKVVVLEYMPNSCLARRLYSRESAGLLHWDRRHRIALGVARALEHLHHRCSPALVHGDLKPSKILLDSEMEPCVAGFGMAKVLEQQQQRVATAYDAPETALVLRRTAKQDVFSFGVLLLELLTRQSPSSSLFGDGLTISAWVDKALTSSSWQLHVIDPQCLIDASEAELAEMKALLKLGVWCSQKLPAGRPDMATVAKIIRQIRQPPALASRFEQDVTDAVLPAERAHQGNANATIRSLMLRRMQSSRRVFS